MCVCEELLWYIMVVCACESCRRCMYTCVYAGRCRDKHTQKNKRAHTKEKTSAHKSCAYLYIYLSTGVIDAAVQGGVYMYKDFFTAEFARNDMDMAKFVQPLKEALRHQLTILHEGLQLHKRICSENMLALQTKLEGGVVGFDDQVALVPCVCLCVFVCVCMYV